MTTTTNPKLVGARPQGKGFGIRTTLNNPVEIQRIQQVQRHKSTAINGQQVASFSLVTRRALALLAEYQQTLKSKSQLDAERQRYLLLASTGSTTI
jgi:hypothetical protein